MPAAWAAAVAATAGRVGWAPAAVALFPVGGRGDGGDRRRGGGLDLAEAAALASTASLDSVAAAAGSVV